MKQIDYIRKITIWMEGFAAAVENAELKAKIYDINKLLNEIQLPKFGINLEIPEGVSEEEIVEYIEEAVRCWVGRKDPSDPIFELTKGSVKCSRF